MKHEQLALFQPQSIPAGFRYAPDVIDAAEEAHLAAAFADLPFKEFEFHGFLDVTLLSLSFSGKI